MARRRIAGVRRVRPDEELSVVEHLDELRRRIIIAIASLVVAFGLAYGFHERRKEGTQHFHKAGEIARCVREMILAQKRAPLHSFSCILRKFLRETLRRI